MQMIGKINQTVSPKTLKSYDESLTNLIYEYYNFYNPNKNEMVSREFINITRNFAMESLKIFMDDALTNSKEYQDGLLEELCK
jgi:hypothetical protein